MKVSNQIRFAALVSEIKPTIRLAVPVVIGEIGWMAMGVADTILVSHLGPSAIGAAGIGGSVYFTFAVFGMGLFLGLDTLVSQAFGAGDSPSCRKWLRTALLLAAILTPLLSILFLIAIQTVNRWGLSSDVLPLVQPYMRVIVWSTGPLMFYAAFRRYLQSIGIVQPVMIALLAANLLNIAGNLLLVDGNLGFPALGVKGSAWATVISRFFLAISLGWTVWLVDRDIFSLKNFRSILLADINHLIRLGLPAASQITLEVGIFTLATTLVGRMEPFALAAHQIVLNITSLTFMIPLGIASATAVRVGHAIGARQIQKAQNAGWAAIGLTIVIMIALAITFISIPRFLLFRFSTDPQIIHSGIKLLALAAIFQVFDGLQAVTTGALRGWGDTLTPAVCNMFAHWLIGLPVGVFLAFRQNLGVSGIWIGLSTGLIVTGSVLLAYWARKSGSVQPINPEAP